MNIKREFEELFDQLCFLLSLPFALLALVTLGIAWLCQKIVFTLDPSWEEIQDAHRKEIEP